MDPDKISALAKAGSWDLCSTSQAALKRLDLEQDPTTSAARDLIPGTIYNSFAEGGHRMRLFKTLFSNVCVFDCKYCENSCSACRPDGSPRASFEYSPAELADVFRHLYSTHQAEGLFLTSTVVKDPDSTMERMVDAVRRIREGGFTGYVHFKILPGAGRELVKQACELADRVSINLEAPNKSRLSELSSMKSFDSDILRRQEWIRELEPQAGQTTQMVVGAGGETDLEVLERAEKEYVDIGVRRVYYSAFQPLPGTPLEARKASPAARQRRLYCADFMMRKYGIPLKEFRGVMLEGNLPPGDPKVRLALERFDEPVDINNAEYEDLIRLPGVGPVAAACIKYVQESGMQLKRRKQLKKLGVVLKRAEPFIKIDGHSQKRLSDYEKTAKNG